MKKCTLGGLSGKVAAWEACAASAAASIKARNTFRRMHDMVGWWDHWGEESTAGTHKNSRVPLDIVVLVWLANF